MSRGRECFDPYCCPQGLREHIQNYRHQRNNPPEYRTGFIEYWFWELKSLIGLNTVLCFKCYEHYEFGERKCRKHKKPPLTLSQRIAKKLKRHKRVTK